MQDQTNQTKLELLERRLVQLGSALRSCQYFDEITSEELEKCKSWAPSRWEKEKEEMTERKPKEPKEKEEKKEGINCWYFLFGFVVFILFAMIDNP